MSQLQKALVIPTLTGTPEVQSVPRPAPTSEQVVVKVVAAALNPADWKAHVLKIWPEYYPLTLGWDGAGEVEAVASDVSDFSKGDRVIFQGWQDEKAKVLHGTFQQYVAVPTHIIAKIPDNVSFDEAATLFTGLATAANPLYSHKPGTESLRLSPPWENGRGKYTGKSILILGGAGQVGQFAIQFAKLSGFGPIIVTASPHNAALLKPYGATHVIDRKLPTESIVADIHAIVGESGIDLVFDAVSEDNTLALAAAAVREGGQAVVVAPHKAEIFPKLFGPKHVEWVIARGVQSSERNKGALAGLWRELSALLEEGTLTPTKYELLGGLEAVPGGMERMQRNEVSGIKLVVHPHDTQ